MSFPVDWHSRYLRPKIQSPDAPAQPIVELILVNGKRHFGAFGLLDSGSVYTVVSTTYADLLKIDYKASPVVEIIGLGGTRSKAYKSQLKMVLKVPNYAWLADVVISTAVEGFPFHVLLGHEGFFDRFDVTFQTRYTHFHIKTEKPPNP